MIKIFYNAYLTAEYKIRIIESKIFLFAEFLSLQSFYLQSDTVEYLENKMVAQESVIANVELRNCFSLHCLHMETQLVHAHLEILATVLQSLVNVQIRGHSEVKFLHCA